MKEKEQKVTDLTQRMQEKQAKEEKEQEEKQLEAQLDEAMEKYQNNTELVLDNMMVIEDMTGEAIHVPMMSQIVVERIHADAQIPKYASEGDSGADVYATEDMIILPGETKLAKLGLLIEIPRHTFHELGYRWELQARPRSGVSLKTSLRVANAPGTIDNHYRNEVGIILQNTRGHTYVYAEEHSYDNSDTLFIEKSRYVTCLDGTEIDLSELDDAVLAAIGFEAFDYARKKYTPVRAEGGSILVRKGDRIAQIVFNEVIRPVLGFREGKVNTEVSRGGGFGHTGK